MRTGEIQLPLGDTTLYDTSGYGLDGEAGGVGSVQSIIDRVRASYHEEWAITLYVRKGPDYCGKVKS
jgi:hypothetical protein